MGEYTIEAQVLSIAKVMSGSRELDELIASA